MTLQVSVSQPRLPSEFCTRQNSLVTTLLEELEAYAAEQETATRRVKRSWDRIGRQLLLSGHHWLPCTTPTRQSLALDSPGEPILNIAASRATIPDHDHDHVDILRQKNRQLLELLNENERLRLQLDTARGDAATSKAKLSAELEAQRKLHLDSEENAAKAMDVLVEQNLRLTDRKDTLEAELQAAGEDAEERNQSRAENIQELQELAMAAFERCNALESENVDLKQAMHTFAQGSTSATIQQLQKIITNLTKEVAQYKKRDTDLKAKENALRDKGNNSIIRAMRRQTRELKVGRTDGYYDFFRVLIFDDNSGDLCNRKTQISSDKEVTSSRPSPCKFQCPKLLLW